jgi:AraC-like DNA-binding protein
MPLLGVAMGTFLLLFVLLRRVGLGKRKKVRYVLAGLIFIYTFMALDYYFTIVTKGNTAYFGVSYLFNHLSGFLFYTFVLLFTGSGINMKKWVGVAAVYTLLRWAMFFPLFKYNSLTDYFEFAKESSSTGFLELEYLLISVLNIVLMFLALFHLRKAPMVLTLNKAQKLNYKWMKFVLFSFVILQMGVLTKDLMNNLSMENFEASLKIETLLITLFFFVFTFSIIHFPVFAFTGDFEDLHDKVRQKYAKSSLKDSSGLFREIDDLIVNEKLYLDFDLKLNSLATRLDKSVHHISQAIYQSTGKSFPDYINGFRIEKAKTKLLETKPDTIFTISLDVGFNSKAAFYAAFKKATSKTPSEFRKSHKA